jgi:hypothetical protein
MEPSKTLAQEILDRAKPRVPGSFGLTQSERTNISDMVEGFIRTEVAQLGPEDECSYFSLQKESVEKLRSRIRLEMFPTNPIKQKMAIKHFNTQMKDWERYIQCSELIKKIQFSATAVARSFQTPHDLPL